MSEPQAGYYPLIIQMLGKFPAGIPESLGEELKIERLQRGLNRADMARLVGLPLGVWSRLEENVYPPSCKELEQLRTNLIDVGAGIVGRGEEVPTGLSGALKQSRLDKGLSQLELARVLGYMNNSSWSRVELNGQIPGRDKWEKIRTILGVDVEEFVLEA